MWLKEPIPEKTHKFIHHPEKQALPQILSNNRKNAEHPRKAGEWEAEAFDQDRHRQGEDEGWRGKAQAQGINSLMYCV